MVFDGLFWKSGRPLIGFYADHCLKVHASEPRTQMYNITSSSRPGAAVCLAKGVAKAVGRDL
jgi:hypothetical protein